MSRSKLKSNKSPSAGYSGTPLPQKLGIRPGDRVALIHAPQGFEETLGRLPARVELKRGLRGSGAFEVLVVFAAGKKDLKQQLPELTRRMRVFSGLWIAWPKKSSGVKTDLSKDVVRKLGLKALLVDNKVCAIDRTWSAHRFVWRLEDR